MAALAQAWMDAYRNQPISEAVFKLRVVERHDISQVCEAFTQFFGKLAEESNVGPLRIDARQLRLAALDSNAIQKVLTANPRFNVRICISAGTFSYQRARRPWSVAKMHSKQLSSNVCQSSLCGSQMQSQSGSLALKHRRKLRARPRQTLIQPTRSRGSKQQTKRRASVHQ